MRSKRFFDVPHAEGGRLLLKRFSGSAAQSEMKKFDLAELLRESRTFVESKAKVEDVALNFLLAENIHAFGNEIEVEQVIVNLVDNAIDAVKDLSEKWVEIQLFTEDDTPVIRVIDSGSGIPKEVADKIFEPFFTTKAVGKGTGLGLSISKGILASHNATIEILTLKGHTCFEIRFPSFPAAELLSSSDLSKAS